MYSKKILSFLIVFGLLTTSCVSFADNIDLGNRELPITTTDFQQNSTNDQVVTAAVKLPWFKIVDKLQTMLLMLFLIGIQFIKSLLGISI